MAERLKNAIILVVTSVWGANFIAPIFVKGYKPSPELNVAFMAIIGTLTASKLANKSRNKNDPPSPPAPEA